ncbi:MULTISPECIES: phage holin family protein [unclassified Roseovarius]|uniref:phage holin family protein n=1 Tax=unclassified Roseovarius TaxID=2614913 RepID=UPI00273EE583|nr:phage holin family protein [Roseovarius sp. MMSF_3350]
MKDAPKPPFGVVVARILREARGLLSAHTDLAQRELRQNLRSAKAGLILIAAALLFALVSVHALGVVAVLALADMGLGLGTAAAIVFGVFVVLTIILGAIGMRCLSARAMLPRRTIESLKSDIALFEESHNDREVYGKA